MASRIVVGLFQSEGIAEDARNRLVTEGVPSSAIALKVLQKIGPIPQVMEPELKPTSSARSWSAISVKPLRLTSATAKRWSASKH